MEVYPVYIHCEANCIAFLTTRVKQPEEDNWFKLRRCHKYLKGTIGLKLNRTADGLYLVKCLVDAYYTIHGNCKGHTGTVMTLGKGAVTIFSRKQKILGKSSTEDKLIEADDAVPKALCAK